jgi:hypothetical protein
VRDIMSVELAAVATPAKAAASAAEADSVGFEQRWAAWQAREAAHERAVRRRVAFAAPVLIAAAVVLYAFLGR